MIRRRRILLTKAIFLAGALLAGTTSTHAASPTVRVNIDKNGNQSDGGAAFSSISQDGNLVAFTSSAPDLVNNDTNGTYDVFVRNLTTNKTTRVSVTTGEKQAQGASYEATISGNGKFVVFTSEAANIAPTDENNLSDVFIRDIANGTTTLVSARWGGRVASHERERGDFHAANGRSYQPVVSHNGRKVAFISTASNMGVGYDKNEKDDIYAASRPKDKPWAKSEPSPNSMSNRYTLAGAKAGTANGISGGVIGDATRGGIAISGDGKWVAYGSTATNLVGDADDNGFGSDVYVTNIADPTITTRVSTAADGTQGNYPSLSPSLDTPGVDEEGQVAKPTVAFLSYATNLVEGDTNNGTDIFVKDVDSVYDDATGTIRRANLMPDGTQDFGGAQPLTENALSDDGTRVVFATFGQLTGTGCTGEQVYTRRLDTNETVRESNSPSGGCPDRYSAYAAISGDGKFVTFTSASDHIVEGDSNEQGDVFRSGPI